MSKVSILYTCSVLTDSSPYGKVNGKRLNKGDEVNNLRQGFDFL